MGHLDCCICRYTNVHFGGICAGAIGNVYKLHSIIISPVLSYYHVDILRTDLHPMRRTYGKFCSTILQGIFSKEKNNYPTGC